MSDPTRDACRWNYSFVWPVARVEHAGVWTQTALEWTPRQMIASALRCGYLTLDEAVRGFYAAKRRDDDPWIHGHDPEGPGE